MFGFGSMHPGRQGRLLQLHTKQSQDNEKNKWNFLNTLQNHLYLVLVHVDACLGVPRGVDGAHERVGHRRFWLVGVIGTVVMSDQAAQAGCGDVPGERATVLLLIARVTKGGGERKREGEQKGMERPAMKPPSSRKCAAVREKSV